MIVDADLADARRRLGELIADAGRTVFFTGAGISTESGIDDFRSPGGVWSRMTPIQFSDFLADEDVRREDWRRRFRFRHEFERAQPNVAHVVMGQLVTKGRALAIVTQNIDNLHQRAGVPGTRVIELHGNGTTAACLDCNAPYDLDDLEVEFERTAEPRACDACGGLVKASVISFGQPMPLDAVRQAQRACEACDLMVVVGSSLVVQPAATLPLIARQAGAPLVIVNRDPTPLDGVADLLVRGGIGDAFAAVGDHIGASVASGNPGSEIASRSTH